MIMIAGISFWISATAIGLVALAVLVVALFVTFTLLVALWEKQYVEVYSPLLPDERLDANPYFTVMNQLAAQAGFVPCGESRANRNGKLSQVRAALWISPDASTVAVVAGGKVARVRYRKTLLFSRLRTGKTLLTIDDFTVNDLSETRDTRLILHGDFLELAKAHAARVRLVSDLIEPFAQEKVLHQLNEMEAERVQQIVALGCGRYLDPSHSTWRHTFRGAWGTSFAGFARGIEQAETQSDRQRLKRPGD